VLALTGQYPFHPFISADVNPERRKRPARGREMKFFKTSIRCAACGTKFLYAITEEEVEEDPFLETMCPGCGEMVELENLTPCSELAYENIIEAYEDSFDKEFDFDTFEEELDDDEDDW
jgi:uncharacterized Zn finger protein